MSEGGRTSPSEYHAYRRRRTAYAARIAPAIGLFLFILPVLAAGGRDVLTTAGGAVYVFVIWGILIVVSAFLSRRLVGDGDGDDLTGNPRE
ncbi:MAG: hypothetical protein OXF07_02125 [Rhodobacter sp.]|nr:hypothetical protein [Rhodobacter sp.]MCY4167452.1 hypothetical protein [Rhodobacter sp.]MCY4241207.1 hypothetical protein [Rhodobacter sp.]